MPQGLGAVVHLGWPVVAMALATIMDPLQYYGQGTGSNNLELCDDSWQGAGYSLNVYITYQCSGSSQ